MKISKAVKNFILRRAFRAGQVTSKDIQFAFPESIKKSRVYEIMKMVVEEHSDKLEKQGCSLVPRAKIAPPKIANEHDFLNCLLSGKTNFHEIGLTEKELPFQNINWTNNQPSQENLFWTLMQSVVRKKLLKIEYVGLRKGDEERIRKIFPVGFQKMNDQLRLIAYDLTHEKNYNKPIKEIRQKIYVIPRILSARSCQEVIPKKLLELNFSASEFIEIELNNNLTVSQRKVIEHELNIKKNKVRLPANQKHEYLIRFGGRQPNESAVWPLLSLKQAD